MFIGGRGKGPGGCERGRQQPVLLAELREENLAAPALGCVDWKSWRFAGSNNRVITKQWGNAGIWDRHSAGRAGMRG